MVAYFHLDSLKRISEIFYSTFTFATKKMHVKVLRTKFQLLFSGIIGVSENEPLTATKPGGQTPRPLSLSQTLVWWLYVCYVKLFVWRYSPWWHHQMETFSSLLALRAGNSPATGEFPSQRPVTRSFDVFFELRLNKRMGKQSRRRWFDTPSRSL